MATASLSYVRGPGTPDALGDHRVAAFCSSRFPKLFHAFAYANDIWKHDAFDVESIHRDARAKFQRIVSRVVEPSGLAAGRILLLLGEAGCGKTHLMRAFRNQVHSHGSGYCGYLQMTVFTGQYGRYVLNNLIDSLDKPYAEAQSTTTGLMRLSSALAETCRDIPRDRLDQLREGGLDQPSVDRLINDLADTIILDDRFNTIDIFLVQALLYLQCNDPRIKARVLEYLRCEDLTEHDRRLLGGIVPCTYSDAPHRIIERLGQLIWAVERAPLILCVDQLEDVFDFEGIGQVDRTPKPPSIPLEQAWNEFRLTFAPVVPVDESDLAAVLVEAIQSCSDEVERGERFEAEAAGRIVPLERHSVDQWVECILVGVCNKRAQGGGLARQIDEVVKRAGERTPVIVRSTDFPTNPKAAVSQQLGQLITGGGRRVVVQDSDWRAMMAMSSFRQQSGTNPSFVSWLKLTHPLTSLNSLRVILDLDHVGRHSSPVAPRPQAVPPPPARARAQPPPAAPAPAPAPPPLAEPIESLVVGTSTDRRSELVTIEPGELTRHAAFLGAPGSGKTTAALCVVEQLLLRGVPAILVDRKGDLCSYARPDMNLRRGLEGEARDHAARLRATVEVALYTPHRPDGRPLSIAAVSAGLGALPAHDREQAAKCSAAALAGMMNYSERNRDQSCLAILSRAIDLLSQETPQAAVPIETLVALIAERDSSLLSAVGRLDVKLFDHLVQDLETLRLNQGDLLAAQGEPLDVEALFGLGAHGTPRKTQLSIISTKFLGTNQDAQFWVAQFLMTLGRWISRSPHPSGSLQVVILFDEADLYLPAVRQPATKEPMEHLLRRAWSAGLGLLLATQSPGDFDYKCRDNIRFWFVGQVKEANSIAKMKPMLSECRIDVAAQLPSQETGEFFLIHGRHVTGLRACPPAVDPRQIPEDEIVTLSKKDKG